MHERHSSETVTLTIDHRRITAPAGTTVLEAARMGGIAIPHLCYHPHLSIDGSCRLCAVEVEGNPRPVISCREKVREGMVVYTETAMTRTARESALEFLLANHPLDCPVCDKAGECLLQDYYFAYSRKPSRFAEEKIRKPKAANAGPRVILDAERCVGCTRCIRFCEEIAGTHEIGFTERGNRQEITARGTLNNNYSLCTVDLCPVGALLSKDFRFRKRVWFLDSSPAVCTGCAAGCNTWIDHAGGVVHRLRPRENPAVNGCWMCDEGRMTYTRLAGEARVTHPLLRTDEGYRRIGWEKAIALAAERLGGVSGERIAGILSAQATLEENAALDHLLRRIVGTPHVFVHGHEPDAAFADAFLRDADRNPNTRGAQLFARNRPSGAYDAYLVMGGLNEEQASAVARARPAAAILLAAHLPVAQWPDIILPLAPVEEQEGTLINREGRMQRTYEAYPPRDEAESGWRIASRLAGALGADLALKTPRDAYALARSTDEALAAVAYESIEGTGVVRG